MSDEVEATGPAPDDDEDDDYVPLALPEPPEGEEARRAWREEQEARETQREIVLGRLAVAYETLDTAEEAGNEVAAVAAREKIRVLAAERDRL
jgi:hypothetical protein